VRIFDASSYSIAASSNSRFSAPVYILYLAFGAFGFALLPSGPWQPGLWHPAFGSRHLPTGIWHPAFAIVPLSVCLWTFFIHFGRRGGVRPEPHAACG